MAVYPAGNPGVHPLDPDTKVGQFRLVYGDTQSEPYDPVEAGFQNYSELSDAEIEIFLTRGDDSVNRAIGSYYMRLSGDAAKQSIRAQDYDLVADLTKRAADLRATAAWWFDQADAEDASGEDAFIIVPTGSRCEPWPELAAHPACGCRGACFCGRW